MKRWYFSVDGQMYGPVSSKELFELMDAGDLQGDSLVLEVGDEKWVRLEEKRDDLHEDVTKEDGSERDQALDEEDFGVSLGREDLAEDSSEEFSLEEVSLGSEDASEVDEDTATLRKDPDTVVRETLISWIVLKKVEEDGKFKFVQNGPFSTSEVLEKIQTGDVKYSDSCWHQGMSEWKLVRDEALFAGAGGELEGLEDVPRPSQKSDDFVLPASETVDFATKSIQFSSTEVLTMPSQDVLPEEVVGEDLAHIEADDGNFAFSDETGVGGGAEKMDAPSVLPSAPEEGSGESDPMERNFSQDTSDIQLETLSPEAVKKILVGEEGFSAGGGAYVPKEKTPVGSRQPSGLSKAPLPENSLRSSGRSVLDRPDLKSKLMEIELKSRSSSQDGFNYRLVIILVGALMLLLFGLKLARDLTS